jgi:hypothetical protein
MHLITLLNILMPKYLVSPLEATLICLKNRVSDNITHVPLKTISNVVWKWERPKKDVGDH